jgi:hypothetical protein
MNAVLLYQPDIKKQGKSKICSENIIITLN